MRGCKYFFGINRINVAKRNVIFKPEKRTSRQLASLLIKKGQYNGDTLSCFDFSISKEKMRIECGRTRFFDFLSARKKQSVPKLVNVNAIIRCGNSILLIKRGSKVMGYKRYWDCPAGFVPFNSALHSRMLNRIENDLRMPAAFFSKGKIIAVGINKWYLSIFYEYKLKAQKKKIIDIANKSKDILLVELDRRKMNCFLKKNRTVFPEVLKHLAK